jgi:hypothetical protein
MKRQGEILRYGAGDGASIAARLRTQPYPSYRAAGFIEECFGERRAWDVQGRIMHASFPQRYFPDATSAVSDGQNYDEWGYVA